MMDLIKTNIQSLQKEFSNEEKAEIFKALAKLEARRRDKIPLDTLAVWMEDFKNSGYSVTQLVDKITASANRDTYGVIQIKDILDSDYVDSDLLRLKVKEQVDKILSFYNYSIDKYGKDFDYSSILFVETSGRIKAEMELLAKTKSENEIKNIGKIELLKDLILQFNSNLSSNYDKNIIMQELNKLNQL